MRAHILALLLVTAGCGGAQRGAEAEAIPLGQARANEVMLDSLANRDAGAATTNVAAELANGTEVNVDVFVESVGAGYVYMNEQDRRDYGPIPDRAEGSELHAVLASRPEGGGQFHVLIMQDVDFSYIPNPRADSRRPEETTIDYVEARLRRDTLDFLQAIIDLRGGAD